MLKPDATENGFQSALHAVEALSKSADGNLMTKAGLRYTRLTFRQTTSKWFSERALLFVGRVLGFGLKIWRALVVWLILSAFTTILVAHQSDREVDFSVGGLVRFVSLLFEVGIEPSSLIRGASSDGALARTNLSEAARFGLRALLALPFSSALLAILRRTTWTRD